MTLYLYLYSNFKWHLETIQSSARSCSVISLAVLKKVTQIQTKHLPLPMVNLSIIFHENALTKKLKRFFTVDIQLLSDLLCVFNISSGKVALSPSAQRRQ